MKVKKEIPELPRFGVQFRIPESFSQMTWYGREPHETYQDRKTGAAFGKYTCDTNNQGYPYIFPQESGNKTDVRWATFLNEMGKGFRITGLPEVDIRHRLILLKWLKAQHITTS